MKKNLNINYILYPMFAVIILLVIIAIVIIWTPTFAKVKKNAINSYVDYNYEEQITSYYTQYLNNNLKITNFDELYSKIDSNYMKSLNISDKEELKEYLRENSYISMNVELQEFEIHQSDTSNYIIVPYKIKDTIKYISITESSPYNFKISFMDNYNIINSSSDFNISRTLDDVDYNFEIIESTTDTIKFKLSITNNSQDTITYDFSYLDSVQIVYGDNLIMNMASVANSTTSKYSLTPGSMTSVELYYNLPYEQQFSITGVKINNASINNNSYNIEI